MAWKLSQSSTVKGTEERTKAGFVNCNRLLLIYNYIVLNMRWPDMFNSTSRFGKQCSVIGGNSIKALYTKILLLCSHGLYFICGCRPTKKKKNQRHKKRVSFIIIIVPAGSDGAENRAMMSFFR